jgi:hypothetical protein
MSRNLVRIAILAWLVVSMRAGFVDWSEKQVPVSVRTDVTPTNLTGLSTVLAEYRCPAPIGGDGPPRLVDQLANVVEPLREPCLPYRGQRQALVWLDLAFGVVALGLTFAHLPKIKRARREATVNTA